MIFLIYCHSKYKDFIFRDFIFRDYIIGCCSLKKIINHENSLSWINRCLLIDNIYKRLKNLINKSFL